MDICKKRAHSYSIHDTLKGKLNTHWTFRKEIVEAEAGISIRTTPMRNVSSSNQHLSYQWAIAADVFVHGSILCIVFGAVGNTCLCFFFGNPKTRIYKTRDAIYIRRISFYDMLICSFVLPYSILYQTRLVKNNFLCKSMELIQHMLTYSSHMMLASYSFEFPRRISYATVKKTLDLGSFLITVLAFVFSYPTLFLYEIDVTYQANNISMITNTKTSFVKDFCHIVTRNTKPTEIYKSNSSLRVHYYGAFFLCYGMAFVLVLVKTMDYFDQLSIPGRKSIGVQVTEKGFLDRSSTLKNNRWQQRISRHSQTGHRIVLAEYLDTTSEDMYSVKSWESRVHHRRSYGLERPMAVDRQTWTQTFNDDTGVKVNTEDLLRCSFESTVDRVGKLSEFDQNNANPETEIGVQLMGETDIDNAIRLAHLSSSRHWNNRQAESPAIRGMKRGSYLVSKYSLPWLLTNYKKKSILKRPSGELLRIQSYKKPIMCLIVLDFIIILIAVSLHLYLEDKMSVMIIFIHTKSVFTFYFLCLVNENLRSAVLKKVCFKSFWEKKKSEQIHYNENSV